MVPVNEVRISGTAMLYELMTRNGFFLQDLKRKHKVARKQIFTHQEL